MIRRNTWIVVVLLLALVGFSFYLKNHKAQLAAAATPTSTTGGARTPLFGAADGTVTAINVKDTSGQSVEVARNASGVWVLKAPIDTAADQGAAEAAATQVTSLQVLSSVQLGLDLVGLDKPSYTMSFTFSSGKTRVLAVGALTPIQDGYYTSLDGGPVRIVDKQGLDALIQLVSQPPFATTATPEVSPTSTFALPSATIEPTGTLLPGGTETPAPATATP